MYFRDSVSGTETWEQDQMNKQNPGKRDQSRKIFSLWPYHPKHALSHLDLEVKQDQAW
jgi:hypothetical protein